MDFSEIINMEDNCALSWIQIALLIAEEFRGFTYD